ncbi:hypothetical protein B0H13DRAFT_1855613 [Mycena leptocephala]|nr:hypothetical protein B0H13DRAFT_1855613 [Mycena leptocephala]
MTSKCQFGGRSAPLGRHRTHYLKLVGISSTLASGFSHWWPELAWSPACQITSFSLRHNASKSPLNSRDGNFLVSERVTRSAFLKRTDAEGGGEARNAGTGNVSKKRRTNEENVFVPLDCSSNMKSSLLEENSVKANALAKNTRRYGPPKKHVRGKSVSTSRSTPSVGSPLLPTLTGYICDGESITLKVLPSRNKYIQCDPHKCESRKCESRKCESRKCESRKNMNILTGAWLASRYFPVIYPVAPNIFSVNRVSVDRARNKKFTAIEGTRKFTAVEATQDHCS